MSANVAWRAAAAVAVPVAGAGIVGHAGPLDAGLWLGFGPLPGPSRPAAAPAGAAGHTPRRKQKISL